MAATALNPEPSEAVCGHLLAGESVVVDGGAGSGKTHALVGTIAALFRERPSLRVACITYTNAAAEEVAARAGAVGLRVSTIHDFLWDCIRHFQDELVAMLREAVEDDGRALFKAPVDGEGNALPLEFDAVSYKDYVRISDGIVSHDQVLELAQMMFAKHPKLGRITADRYPCILVDEYQDASPAAAEILLRLLRQDGPHRCSIAFYGDPMQLIYDGSIGSLEPHVSSGLLHLVRIEQNRRNPAEVIALANKLRTDGLQQAASDDRDAPNMEGGRLVEGRVLLVEGDDPKGDEAIAASGVFGDNPDESVRILRLTHKLIAEDGGFPNVHALYSGKDAILDYAAAIRKKVGGEDRRLLEETPLSELAESYPCTRRGGTSRLEEIRADDTLRLEFERASGSTLRQLKSHYLKSDNLYALADQRGIAPDWCPVTVAARRVLRMVGMFEAGDFSGLLEENRSLPIANVAAKAVLVDVLGKLSGMRGLPTGEAIDAAMRAGLLVEDDSYARFRADHRYLFGRMRSVELAEFERFFAYYDESVSLMTQHKVKGLEYDHVVVTLDNGNWKNYNYGRRLIPPSGGASDGSVAERTRKLLYVACTRAKRTLVLYTCGAKMDRETVEYLFRPDQVVALSDVVGK